MIYFLGFLIDFVSGPVSSGFTSAVALIIITSQVKDILGIPAQGSQFLEMWKSLVEHLHETSAWDAALGVTCIALLLFLRVYRTKIIITLQHYITLLTEVLHIFFYSF